MERLRRLRDRWPWLDRTLDVHKRFGQVNGSFVASAITIQVFLSLFPLLLVVTAVVGLVASNNASTTEDIIEFLGLRGQAAENMTTAIENAERTRRAASIIGFVGLLWSALGVTNALEQGVRIPWQESSEGLRSRLVGLGWLIGAGLLFLGSLALGSLLNFLPDAVPTGVTTGALIVVGLLVEFGLFLWTFWLFGNRRVGIRALVPGAILAAVGFEVLKLAGTVVVPRLVASSSSLYGPIGVVFAVLAWLALFARLIVYSSTLNAVLHERREGTVTVEMKAPRLPGDVPTEATRGGVVVHRSESHPA